MNSCNKCIFVDVLVTHCMYACVSVSMKVMNEIQTHSNMQKVK